ncbi:MAG: Ig-like domain-containing protein [Bacteroidales bacterium]|nr:Ig-like domain-containing protein [Bacteroidales bacterium]
MNKPVFLILISIILLSIINCARVGSPVGGKKDILPPEIIESTPNNYSKNFGSDKIEIELNEFVRLDNLQQKLVISPPLDEKPEIFVRGKSIIIELGKQELKQNTTYTFSFYDAIIDNNEGNPIEDYEFVFSTGNQLDSLSVNGIVLRAFDLEPEEEGVEVLLYDLLDDTIPQTTPPLYIGKPDEEGKFRINNIKADTFRIFAIKDGNRNHYFDQAGEAFAFLDSTLLVSAPPEFFVDTMRKDTIGADTIDTDTTDADIIGADIAEIDKEEIKPDARLFLFLEDHSIQYLKNSTRETREHIQLVFNIPLKERKLEITPIDIDTKSEWFIKEEFVIGDTVNIWITDTIVSGSDLVTLKLEYMKEDSTGNDISFTDTSLLRYIAPTGKKRGSGEIADKTEKTLVLTPSTGKNAQVELNQKIVIESETPVKIIDTSKIKLFLFEDSLKINTGYILEKDSLQIRKFRFSTKWQEAAKYQLFFEPGAFTGIYGYGNDTLLLDFRIRKLDYYGKIIVTLKEIPESLIIQLLDNKGEVSKEKTGWKNNQVEFSFLHPGKYMLKAIYDRNKNGKWDTGNYEEKRQPEKVIFFKKELDVRANWDLEINWDFENEINN